jgi:hypothetical protein
VRLGMILQVGRRQAAAQAVKGGHTSVARMPKGKGAKGASRPGRDSSNAPGSRLKSDRASVVHARGKVSVSSGEALASADLPHVQVDVVSRSGSAGLAKGQAEQPRANDDESRTKTAAST